MYQSRQPVPEWAAAGQSGLAHVRQRRVVQLRLRPRRQHALTALPARLHAGIAGFDACCDGERFRPFHAVSVRLKNTCGRKTGFHPRSSRGRLFPENAGALFAHDLFRPAYARRSIRPRDRTTQGLRAGGKPLRTFRGHANAVPACIESPRHGRDCPDCPGHPRLSRWGTDVDARPSGRSRPSSTGYGRA